MINDISVTVLMTVYNGGRYLDAAIKSVLNQTFQDFEFLIINDCSMDDTLACVHSYNDKRIKVHNNLQNVGQTRSLNTGLRLAKGNYVARIDADDVALPCWLEKQVNFISDNPSCSVVSAYVVAIDEADRIKKVYKPPARREDIILRSLFTSPINHVSSIFKKKDVLEHGGYEERYKISADYDLWRKLLRDSLKVTTNKKVLMAIREHAQSLSKSEHEGRGLQEITEVVLKYMDEFTSVKFSSCDINLFCRANFSEGSLDNDEFKKAVAINKEVYEHLKPSLGIKHRKAMRWRHKRCTTLYLKRFFFHLRQSDYEGARQILQEGLRECGLASIFVIFFVASLFGGIFLKNIPGLYEEILKGRAWIQANGKLNIGVFH